MSTTTTTALYPPPEFYREQHRLALVALFRQKTAEGFQVDYNILKTIQTFYFHEKTTRYDVHPPLSESRRRPDSELFEHVVIDG